MCGRYVWWWGRCGGEGGVKGGRVGEGLCVACVCRGVQVVCVCVCVCGEGWEWGRGVVWQWWCGQCGQCKEGGQGVWGKCVGCVMSRATSLNEVGEAAQV